MKEDDEWRTEVVSQGVSMDAPELEKVIRIEEGGLLHLDDEDDRLPVALSPPEPSDDMFPGILKDIVSACCEHSEASRVAVAMTTLTLFSSMIGRMAYIPIGDERRYLTLFVLMVGMTGMGKGSSSHGPFRIMRRVEDFLALELDRRFQAGQSEGIKVYPNLRIHSGGLSSGEGLAAALDDGTEGSDEAVTDKRICIKESEFGNTLNHLQRIGCTLSPVMRCVFDGEDIRPMTKRDKVAVSDPYVCMIAHVTSRELNSHNQTQIAASNGLLNRFILLWQSPEKTVAFPDPMNQGQVDDLAHTLSDRILFARGGSFETHYKKIRSMANPIGLSSEARRLWEQEYNRLVNQPDCDQVMVLTRRHRLHALVLASLFALLDCRFTIEPQDILSALAWCEYARSSIVYSFKSLADQNKAERYRHLSRRVLRAIDDISNTKQQCNSTDLHRWFSNKVVAGQLNTALELLMHHIPPLIRQSIKKKGRGRPSVYYSLTDLGIKLNSEY